MAKHTLLSVPQIARETGISKSCLYELIRRGEIPHLRYMRQIRLSLQDVTKWIDSNFRTDYKSRRGFSKGHGGRPEKKSDHASSEKLHDKL